MLGSITGVMRAYALDTPPAEMFGSVLEDLIEIAGAEYAYIAEVRRDERGDPYLLTWAISDIAWDATTRALYEEHAVLGAGIEFRNLATLFGSGLTGPGARVLCNDPVNDPRAGGRPPGHPPLNSYLGMPVRLDGELIGQVGLANRPGGFDEIFADSIEPLCTCIGWLIERSRTNRDRSEAEKRRQALEGRHTAVLDSLHEIVTVVSPDGTWVESSLAGTRQLGYPKGFDPPGGLFSLIHEEDRDAAMEAFRSVLSGSRHPMDRIDLRIAAIDGSYRTYSVCGEDLTSNPSVAGVLVTAHDVSSIRATEAAERERSSQLSTLLATLHHPVLLLDADHRVVWVNEAWRQAFTASRTAEEMTGSVLPMDRWILGGKTDPAPEEPHPRLLDIVLDPGGLVRHVRDTYAAGVPAFGYRSAMVDGRVLETDYVPVAAVDGRHGHLWSTRDVTDHVLLEQERVKLFELEQQQRRAAESQVVSLQEMNRLKTDLIASVAHELRTPLASILAAVEALVEDAELWMAGDTGDLLSHLRRDTASAVSFVDDLLSLSALEAGKVVLEPRPLGFEAEVHRAVESFGPASRRAGVALRQHRCGDTTPACLDSRKLETVVRNLVSNALKFTQRGGVVDVRTNYTLSGWTLSVADTGMGIPEDQIPHLFDRFFRARNAVESGVRGTGLGLAIAQDMVHLHGGTLSVQSSPAGTTITAVFPPEGVPR